MSWDTTTALANIVPVSFQRGSSLRQAQDPEVDEDMAALAGEMAGADLEGVVASRQLQSPGELEEMQQVESQLISELEVQERQTGVQGLLRQWKRSAIRQTTDSDASTQQVPAAYVAVQPVAEELLQQFAAPSLHI